MKSLNKLIFVISIGLGLLGVALTMLLPLPNGWTSSWSDYHIPLAVTSLNILLALGSSVLFLLTLDVYTPRLRRAYQIIVLAHILDAVIGGSQIPIISAFNLWTSPWVTFGFVGLPFMVGAVLFYVGTRALARLIGIRSLTTRFYVVILLSAVGTGLSFLLPHAAIMGQEAAFKASNAVATWDMFFYFFSGLVSLQIMRRIGQHYTKAMTWLALSLFSSASIGFTLVTTALVTGIGNSPTPMVLLVEFISSTLPLITAYIFTQAKDYTASSGWFGGLFTAFGQRSLTEVTTVLDGITALASLVSNPAAIDPTLDQVRTVTAKLEPGQQPSAADEKLLLGVYSQIEQYLITQDPVRKFSSDELRARLATSLRQQLETYEHNSSTVKESGVHE